MTLLTHADARSLAIDAMASCCTKSLAANTQVDHWLEADLRGHPSHGLMRLPRLVERIRNGVARPDAKGNFDWIGPAYMRVDGERGLGPVIANRTLDELSERARQQGICIGAISNNNHLGMLAIYAERIAGNGQILIAITTSEALVHPWGGTTALLGTNPIAIGVPANPEPFVLDMATSKISMGKVHDHAARNVPLQPDWALDADGNTTLDAIRAKDGALSPFGDAKGYALGLAFEILVAGLTQSAFGKDVKGTLDTDQLCNKGDLFIVIDPADGQMSDAITRYLGAVRSSRADDPRHPVIVPGDRARMARAKNIQKGISVSDETLDALRSLAG